MKTLLVWITLTALSCTATSQNLTPKVQWQGNDTLFCFTMPQARILAKHLEQGRYCDSLLEHTETQVLQLYQLQADSDSTLLCMKEKNANQERLLGNQRLEMADLNLELEQREKKLQNQCWQKCLFIVTTVFLGAWLIAK